jgi:hypothetical protein
MEELRRQGTSPEFLVLKSNYKKISPLSYRVVLRSSLNTILQTNNRERHFSSAWFIIGKTGRV